MNLHPKTSALTDMLSSLAVSGQVLLVDEYRPPWGIAIPDGATLAAALGVGNDTRVVPFHIVRRGAFELHDVGDGPALVIRAGEAAICTGARAHRMLEGGPSRLVPFGELLRDGVSPLSDGAGGSTELVCGVFLLRNTRCNPLVDALPPIMRADLSGRDGGKAIELLAQLLVNELRMNREGHDYMTSRLVELLCAEALRQHLDTAEDHAPGLFRALRDPRIGAALDAIHAAPAERHSVASLAALANLSPSRFAARFRAALGEPVKRYLTRWRMNLAVRLLRDPSLSIEGVAERCGYGNAAAFSRAFSKHLGRTPRTFRRSPIAGR